MEYYSEQMNKDLRQAESTAQQSDAKSANGTSSRQQ